MKPLGAQTYYELLEVSVSATAAEIRFACDRLTRLYADDQLALYGLAGPGSAQNLRLRLREAMEILTDDELRSVYDDDLGLPPREKDPVHAERQIEMGDLLAESDRPAPRASRPPLPPAAAPVPPGSAQAPPLAEPIAPVEVVAARPPPASAPERRPVEPPTRAEAPKLSEEAAISMLPRPSAPRPSAPLVPEAERPRLPTLTADTEYNGELLRTVRNALGLPLAVVAERSRIDAKHLKNVEADRYDALPATVYLRGILMNLARELKLDGLKVSKSYLALVDRGRSKG